MGASLWKKEMGGRGVETAEQMDTLSTSRSVVPGRLAPWLWVMPRKVHPVNIRLTFFSVPANVTGAVNLGPHGTNLAGPLARLAQSGWILGLAICRQLGSLTIPARRE